MELSFIEPFCSDKSQIVNGGFLKAKKGMFEDIQELMDVKSIRRISNVLANAEPRCLAHGPSSKGCIKAVTMPFPGIPKMETPAILAHVVSMKSSSTLLFPYCTILSRAHAAKLSVIERGAIYELDTKKLTDPVTG